VRLASQQSAQIMLEETTVLEQSISEQKKV
jgi:hypothetical protein